MAYHQNGGRIEIIIKKEGGVSTAGANERGVDEGIVDGETGGGESPNGFGGGTSGFKSRRNHIITTHAIAVAHQVYDITMEYVHSGIGIRNGDQALQQQVQRKAEIFQDATNLATSVAMGASYGVLGGPAGIIAGATFGLVRSAVSTGFKYGSRHREYDFTVFKENNSIEYSRARAGVNWTSGRLR